MTTQKKRLAALLRGAGLVGLWAACAPSQALQYDVGDWLINVDTSLGAALGWRTESRDKELSQDMNANDGNNNFDSGSLTSAKASFIFEVGGEYGDFSFFVRTDGLYDYVYHDWESDMSDLNYLSYNGAIPNGGDVKQGDFPDGTVDEHGLRLRLLDAFITYNFGLGDQTGGVRFGRQVIAWGEATSYQGVNALQNPIDGGVALAPGVEVKEIFLPTAAIDLKWNFTDSISAEAYYKLDWEGSTLPGVGSFLSTSDITGPGSQRILLDPLPSGKVGSGIKPDDSGQWGVVLRYMTEGGTNFDFSFTNSHANIPGVISLVDLAGVDSSAREVYLDDIEVWQGSMSTNVGEAQVYADLAYSDSAPFVNVSQALNADGLLVVSQVERGHYWQGVFGMTDVYTAFPWLSEQITLVAEAMVQGNNKGESKLEGSDYVVTDTSWGYQFRLILNYYSVIPGMDMEVPITFKHDVDGYGNPNAMNNGLKEDQKAASLGVDAFYLTNWQFSAKYSWYFDDDGDVPNLLGDRDNLSISMKYTF
jgi:hypothetical protein